MQTKQRSLLHFSVFHLILPALLVGFLSSPLYGQDKSKLLDLLSDPAKAKQLSDPVAIPFSPADWVGSSTAKHRVERHLGKESLFLNGRILFPEVSFRDGIIEVDVAPNVNRSFAGLIFRVKQEDEAGTADRASFEEIYIRLHKSGMPDAVQYSPIYNGQSTWQLYRQHQANAEFKHTAWTHLKIVVVGETAELYLDDNSNPTLVVDNLRLGHEAGPVGLFALFGNHFANFRYTPYEVTAPPASKPQMSPKGVIKQWMLTSAMPANPELADHYPGKKKLDKATWQTADVEPNGLLPISKYVVRHGPEAFEQNPEHVVWAKVTLESSKKQQKKLFFDYSDKAVVFLNGNPIYAGNNAFRSKGILERGDLGIDGNAVFLNLKKGNNELLIAVTERANGWGLMARFVDLDGVVLKP